MEGAGLGSIDIIAREATLFAAIWFLVGGLDDLAVDLVYIARRIRAWLRAETMAALPETIPEGRIAIFVACWMEAAVIEQMLRTALERFDHPDYRLYVGTYPNDRDTIDRVAEVAEADSRVRLVIGPNPGPTTKADCLNVLWRALLRDEAAEGPVAAVMLHDAEDLVHAQELRIVAHAIGAYAAVQLPVLPLPDPRSPLVAGHYCDEFAEAHAKQLPVRQALGAALPLAGVGCAIRRDMLARIAERRGGLPFDEASLTEDYELGLTVAAMGGRTLFARVAEVPGGRPVSVRAYFPARFDAAVRQKGRWMTGIALAGWDRTGWGAPGALSDHWMRMRDRRVTLSMPVLAIAYLALVLWGCSLAGHALTGFAPPPLHPAVRALLFANLSLLGWRVAVRVAFVWRAYGWRQAGWAPVRMVVANAIALLAARRAVFAYVRMLAGGVPHWDKTEHHFPDDPGRAAA
ncbi:MAG: glycosyl transferase family protein [Pseudomonadota bacterium]